MRASRSSRSWVVGGLGIYPFAVLGLWAATPLGLWDSAFIALLLELLPAMALAQLPLADEETPLPRVPVYLSSGATILVLGWFALLVGSRTLGMGRMGLGPLPWGALLGWTVGGTAAALVLLGLLHGARRRLGIQESRVLVELLPRTAGEKGVFAGLSVAAGVGEELAYRGYLIPVMVVVVGSGWGAAFLSAPFFGILHAYQGWWGMVRTALLALLLAAVFLMSGSLWPAMLAHAILDLLAGLVLGETLSRE